MSSRADLQAGSCLYGPLCLSLRYVNLSDKFSLVCFTKLYPSAIASSVSILFTGSCCKHSALPNYAKLSADVHENKPPQLPLRRCLL